MPGDRRVARHRRPGEREAGAERLRQHSTSPERATRLAEHLVGVDDALHREPEDRLGVADRVAAGDGAPRLGDHLRGSLEDRRDRVAREVLGERGDVDRHTTRPPMANTSLQAFAAAMAPKSDGWSTSGGKKSVVDTSATSSVIR